MPLGNFPAGDTALRPLTKPIPTDLDRLAGRPPALNQPVAIDGVPGSGFRYSGDGGYLILGQLIADTTGTPFDQAAKSFLSSSL